MKTHIISMFLIIVLLICTFYNTIEFFTSNQCKIDCSNNSCFNNPINSKCKGTYCGSDKDNCNIIVDPENVNCLDFCIKTYTVKTPDKFSKKGAFKGDDYKHSFFSSKCGECVKNHYDRYRLLKTGEEKCSDTD